ncbi:MAG: aminoacyl-tRNA hydrolase [Spirochaetia bacterium]|nr:aminoacyl-tRNA hydrolase [Spirochaetia bacterium]
MNTEALKESILTNGKFTFSRSSGPGGQNVNKVSTKVRLTVAINLLEGLTSQERETLLTYTSKFLVSSEFLQVTVEDSRSQHRNREIALMRMLNEIKKAVVIPKKRRPSTPSKAAKERRLIEKKELRAKKRLRGKVDPDF